MTFTIKNIIISLISGLSFSAVSLFICSLSERGKIFLQGDTYVSGSVDSLLSGSSVPYIGNIGIAYYALICFIAYLCNPKDDEEYVKTIPWIGTLSWLFLFVFNDAHSFE